MLVLSAALVAASAFGWLALPWIEVWGFVTGAACVWLIVREHIWNWPLGLANNVLLGLLFWRSRLFADAALQAVYFALGVYGWWSWLYGGEDRSELRIARMSRAEGAALALFVPVATWGMRAVLIRAAGAAPFWDALTTALSLAAQVLLCRKRLENWLLWIAVDLLYIPLYLSRGLPLTAALYAVFLVMCLVGARAWHQRWRGGPAQPEAVLA